MHLDLRAHVDQGVREAEPLLVHGLVHDRHAVRLGEGDHERLLPVGHEAGVHVGLDHDGLQRASRVEEADAVVVDLERAADLAEDVEEGQHLGLAGPAHVDVAVGGERGGGPARGLVAVEQRGVAVADQLVDALDADHAVGVDRDDRAHLLQDVDQVHDLGLDRRALELGNALRADRGEQHLLGRADARVRQLQLGAMQALGGRHPDAARELVDHGAELAQHLEVVVDRAVADAAAAEVGDERLAQAVQQRPAEQDRDAAGAGVRVDVGHVRRLDRAGVEQELALLRAVGDLDAVDLEEAADDPDIADVRDVPQHARALAQDGGDHRLGDEVLGSAHLDAALERDAAVDRDAVGREADVRACRLGVLKKRVQIFTGSVLGRQLARAASYSEMRASSRRVRAMSSNPSSKRQRV